MDCTAFLYWLLADIAEQIPGYPGLSSGRVGSTAPAIPSWCEGQMEFGSKQAIFSPSSPAAGMGNEQLPAACCVPGTLYSVTCCPLRQPGGKEQPQALEW